jgi:class 3 adenylate cyclase
MEPRIQYAKTEDGVNIAYWTLGEGLALVQTPPVPFTQVQLDQQVPEDRGWNEFLLVQRRLIRYDARGTGLSDRDPSDLSLNALVADLEAVVDSLGLETFALWGMITGGPVAIAYAARHPDRVSHLVLWSSWARSADVFRSPAAQGMFALIAADWGLFTETAAHAFFGWSVGELAHRAAEFMREGISRETAQALLSTLSDSDVSELLPQIQAPSLVLHSREAPFPDVSVARELASLIPNASLVLLEGSAAGWDLSPQAAGALNEFLGGQVDSLAPTAVRPAAGTVHTILFTDMESSTALTQRLGDAKAQEVRRAHNDIVRDALKNHRGQEIKHTGDGIMASFSSASSALECAIAIQRGVASHVEDHPGSPLGVYIGLNAGEPIAEEGDLFGTSIDLAARMCDHAESGQILASDVVRQLAAGKQFLFSDIGEVELKGFEEPVRLYEVRWREE